MKYEIRISYIVRAMLKTNKFEQYYLDKKLYQLYSYADDQISYMDQLVLTAVEDVDEVLRRSVKLFTYKEIDEKKVLRQYFSQLKDASLKEDLLDGLKNNAGIGRLQQYLLNLNLLEEYEDFRFRVYASQAIEWCEANNIDYIIDK